MMTASGLAKLIEECGELLQVAGKKLAYFTTNDHPDGGPPLNLRLQEEMGDLMGACWFVREKLGLDMQAIVDRAIRKQRLFEEWDRRTDNNDHAVDSAKAAALGLASAAGG